MIAAAAARAAVARASVARAAVARAAEARAAVARAAVARAAVEMAAEARAAVLRRISVASTFDCMPRVPALTVYFPCDLTWFEPESSRLFTVKWIFAMVLRSTILSRLGEGEVWMTVNSLDLPFLAPESWLTVVDFN